MARIEMTICDNCLERRGQFVQAIAEYVTYNREERHACKSCLVHVRSQRMHYRRLPRRGDVTFPNGNLRYG